MAADELVAMVSGCRCAASSPIGSRSVIAEEADDSSGSIGAAWQRAADLYARSCREGNPDRVNWRRSSPNMTATWTAPWSS